MKLTGSSNLSSPQTPRPICPVSWKNLCARALPGLTTCNIRLPPLHSSHHFATHGTTRSPFVLEREVGHDPNLKSSCAYIPRPLWTPDTTTPTRALVLSSATANPEAVKKALTSGLLNRQLDPVYSQVWCEGVELLGAWLDERTLAQYISIGVRLLHSEAKRMHVQRMLNARIGSVVDNTPQPLESDHLANPDMHITKQQ